MFGSNLHLSHQEVAEIPSPPYAALCAARANFSENETSFYSGCQTWIRTKILRFRV